MTRLQRWLLARQISVTWKSFPGAVVSRFGNHEMKKFFTGTAELTLIKRDVTLPDAVPVVSQSAIALAIQHGTNLYWAAIKTPDGAPIENNCIDFMADAVMEVIAGVNHA